MTNLTEQDKAKLSTQEQVLISSINERLKRLEGLYFSKGQETKQPIDTTEQRCEKYEVDVLPVPTRKNDYMVTVCLPLGKKLPKEEANLLSDLIKQYLSNNKF